MTDSDMFVADKAVSVVIAMIHAGLIGPEENIGHWILKISDAIRATALVPA